MQFSFCLNQLINLKGHVGNLLNKTTTDNYSVVYGRKNLISILNIRLSLIILKKSLVLVKSNALSSNITAISIPDSVSYFYVKKFNIEKDTANLLIIAYSRWFGGLLTNFKSTKKFLRLFNKKVFSRANQFNKIRIIRRLRRRFFSFNYLRRPPSLIFSTNLNKSPWIQRECHRLAVPLLAIADASTTTKGCSYVIPGNYDSNIFICFICSLFLSSIVLANSERRNHFEKKLMLRYKYLKKINSLSNNVNFKKGFKIKKITSFNL